MIRHPVELAGSMFYHHVEGDADHQTPEEFARQKIASKDNGGFMISQLLDISRTEPLTDEHLQKAKAILRTKFVIGLMSKMEESVERFDNYFGWHKRQGREQCLNTYIRQINPNEVVQRVEENSEAWRLLEDFLYFDMQLYEFALELYEEQEEFVLLQPEENFEVGAEDVPEDELVEPVAPAEPNVPTELIAPVEPNAPVEP
eukprot:11772306-Ditylum_brightwellii.AAC.1